ncbi:unnamed protein product [Psylliodes chrysocephalus]|uniref:Ig-like domain-containing protein n=1 Tax=Psylliodes chrysocephalus TaxID=3402493 RepID=A0A9P0G8R9_9CUCU|nr:unnamed protein product [Psylliodes chrysocephala]
MGILLRQKNRKRSDDILDMQESLHFDVRGRPFNKALHWTDPKIFGPRAYFVTVSKPAALTLDGVQLDDEGVYRCRVDFKVSPTRNFAINLTVIVPPHQLLIYDNSGRDVNHTIGPLEEKSDLVLTCEVRGGVMVRNYTKKTNGPTYNENTLEEAILEVKAGRLTAEKATKVFNVLIQQYTLTVKVPVGK